jgi:hypothetical protein
VTGSDFKVASIRKAVRRFGGRRAKVRTFYGRNPTALDAASLCSVVPPTPRGRCMGGVTRRVSAAQVLVATNRAETVSHRFATDTPGRVRAAASTANGKTGRIAFATAVNRSRT